MSGSETTETKAATERNPASVTSDWLGEVQKTDRGFQIIRFEDRNEQKCSLQMSSVVDFQQPGTSAVWLGVGNARMHISFDQAKQLRAALGCWIDNGTFDDDGNRCESCGGELGDDAPQYDDADICLKCHNEIKEGAGKLQFEDWAHEKGMILDTAFFADEENNYVNPDTHLAYEIWLASRGHA